MDALSFDLETGLVAPGLPTPTLVCGSTAGAEVGSERLMSAEEVRDTARKIVRECEVISGAHIAFDFAVLVNDGCVSIDDVFAAYEEERVWDVLVAEALDAIGGGHLNIDPRDHLPIHVPGGTKRVNHYKLDVVADLVLGRIDAKKNDLWRLRYAILAGVPMAEWPAEAIQYPKDDARNTMDIFMAQVGLAPRGDGSVRRIRNAHEVPAQSYSAWAMYLGAVWGLRTDERRVDVLRRKMEEQQTEAIARFTQSGLLDANGKKVTSRVKRRVAEAYGASGVCAKCAGTGKVKSEKTGNLIGCSSLRLDDGTIVGCDGTGLDLNTAPTLRMTPADGVSADRDTLSECGDDELADYGLASEGQKNLGTYLPFVESAQHFPLNLRPNVLLETGRTSYDGVVQLLPRKPGIRECFVERPGYGFGSVDYSAAELCSLAQCCLWIVGRSDMADMINATKDPGSLHTALAARMVGCTTEELTARIKSGDKVAKGYRQSAKCFHPDVEILTRRGWIKVSLLTMEDDVASVVPHENAGPSVVRRDPETGRMMPTGGRRDKRGIPEPTMEIVWTKPSSLTQRKATDGLLHMHNYGIDLRVTPDHRMLAKGSTQRLRTVPASEFAQKQGMRGWFNAGMWNGGDIDVDERLLRLAVATQADGNYNGGFDSAQGIRLGFSKVRKIRRLRSLLQPGEYTASLYHNGKVKKLTTMFVLSHDLSQRIKALLDSDKTLPWWWLNLRPGLRAAVLDEAAYWDSHRGERMKCYHYSTAIRKNADVLQAIAGITDRKACILPPEPRKAKNPEHSDMHYLSVRTKPDTRGDNLETEKLDYDGDVYCLSVPSSYVLVRDGGIPVVVGQCINFGAPGGMGTPKIVLTNRKLNAGTTRSPDGKIEYAGIRFCIYIGGAERCGVEKVTQWGRQTIPPTCKACLECAEELRSAWFAQWSEMKEYFKFISVQSELGEITQFVSDRLHGGVGYCDAANCLFQGLTADGAKRALRAVSRECYCDVNSPMYGTRPIAFLHDEILSAVPLKRAHESLNRMVVVMVDEMRKLLPDVYCCAEPALSLCWSKAMEPAYDENGRLMPWDLTKKGREHLAALGYPEVA